MCGQSPLFVPTTINAQIRNIDAVDVAATNISCDNLTVQGNPISDVFQNVISQPKYTLFEGEVEAEKLRATTTNTVTLNATGTTNLSNTTVTSLTSSGSITGTTLAGTLSTAAQPNVTSLGSLTALNLAGSVNQTSGSTTLLTTTVGSLSTAGNITQSGTSATASLKAVTATSISNSGTLTQTGAATFSTNVTQSAGTAIFKALEADSISIAGTPISYIPSGTSYTATTSTTNVALYNNFTRITFQGVSSASAYNLYLSMTNAIGSTSGSTYGMAGATEVTWVTRQIQLYNSSNSTAIAAGSKGWGYVDFIRVSATEYQVSGQMIYKSANNYAVSIVGTITNPFALAYTISVFFTNTPASGSIIISTGW